MDQNLSGSCQCGTVRFRVTGAVTGFYLCHCSRCRKDTGSAHAANMFAPEGEITWTSGAESVRTYRIPGTRHAKSFCVQCGSALPRDHDSGPAIIIPAGSLDGKVGVRATAHICWADRADWDDGLDAIPKLDGLPSL